MFDFEPLLFGNVRVHANSTAVRGAALRHQDGEAIQILLLVFALRISVAFEPLLDPGLPLGLAAFRQ